MARRRRYGGYRRSSASYVSPPPSPPHNGPRNETFIKRFEAPEDYKAFLETCDGYYWDTYTKPHSTIYAGKRWRQALDCLIHGDTANLVEANKILDQMTDERVYTPGLPLRVPAVAGGFVSVPMALQGHPMHMYAREESEQPCDVSPLSIYIETAVSEGVSVQEMTKRGIAALAFAMAMSNIRPVEVYTISAGQTKYANNVAIVTKIASAPLDISRAVFMLTDNAYCRRMAFAAQYKIADTASYMYVNWAFNGIPTSSEYIAKMRALCNMKDQDVLISGGHITDYKMLSNPVQWVKDMIKQHTSEQE